MAAMSEGPDLIGPPTSIDLATELLLGKPRGDPEGHYHLKREYPKGQREVMARAALAYELRREAPHGYFAGLLADLIDPEVRSTSIEKRTVKFVRPRGGRRASGRLDLDIIEFMRKYLGQHPEQTEAAVNEAAKHFDKSERRIWDAWEPVAKTQTSGMETLRAVEENK
jgi:hypothetical protein